MTKMEPTPEQFTEWLAAALAKFDWRQSGLIADEVARLAYAAGADAELEACCEWCGCFLYAPLGLAFCLRNARRPLPSLKAQAIAELDDAIMRGDCITTSPAIQAIRCALESLPDS
jgi:hypothetical protein